MPTLLAKECCFAGQPLHAQRAGLRRHSHSNEPRVGFPFPYIDWKAVREAAGLRADHKCLMSHSKAPTRLFVRTSLQTKLVLAEKPGCPTSLLQLQIAVAAAHPRQCPEHNYAVRCSSIETIRPDDYQGYKLTENCTTAGCPHLHCCRLCTACSSTLTARQVQMPTSALQNTGTSACMQLWRGSW